MSARRRIVVGWAVLCLAGLAATSVLAADSSRDTRKSPAGEPMSTGTDVVDCQEVADDIAQARAEAERERREVLDPSTTPANPKMVITYRAVPEECVDTPKALDLKDR
ncbi:hypothetical protein JL475_20685 [Streptomyces sp. M2CJ-2]|uniref:hypothetical protein n=1 Tax=Streptomyces sp. M2CJ-2 TaxID=2803948 RepID=UPI001929392D|nr:hypothetical protein [Streptomyces sp. M2CJ-2]MBL3668363.1 hypothetical protein [Streptomyces sp. M2CJ-2]